eukprot:CAMPEP_0206529376 /NCGR_PEP_ID=MMETSP0325_2-20121206/2564_1 /ASSEMBLY_ACC=CAM_ASM_000347 /TAXON_ID=2866 /ORGANISM="Crypthecodinium cohnii, Strain Seligo" /LENGTH=494 /DNA_ID=CAMNT_0054025279 /DNA_START=118 /DNA_END=1602 /DNA_ORIENTATION=+
MTIGNGCPELPSGALAASACVWRVDPETYGRLQQVAYINQDGASWFSICLLMLVYPGTICFQQLLADVADKQLSPGLAHFVAEFGCSIFPLTVAFSTPHTAWIALVNLFLVCCALLTQRENVLAWPLLVTRIRATRAVRKEGVYAPVFSSVDKDGTKPRFVSEYRAVLMVCTCIAILAVDFPSVFPREHAKTEAYGYSLMDLGTGSIVCSSAVCARSARGLPSAGPSLRLILRRLRSIWPLILIGFVRLLTLRGLDYHVPTSEYGVHWNFFFTLAVVAVFGAGLEFGPKASLLLGSIVICSYQVALSRFGGAEYVLHAQRSGLFSANREGILSSLGYLTIHWWSIALGSICHCPPNKQHEALSRAVRLLVISISALAMSQVLEGLGIRPSHRMCNLTYCTFVIGVNALVLGTLALVDLFWPWPRRPLPVVYQAIEESKLIVFLGSNLLTGLTNLVLQPLVLPSTVALSYLSLYSFLFSMPLAYLHERGKVLKLA